DRLAIRRSYGCADTGRSAGAFSLPHHRVVRAWRQSRYLRHSLQGASGNDLVEPSGSAGNDWRSYRHLRLLPAQLLRFAPGRLGKKLRFRSGSLERLAVIWGETLIIKRFTPIRFASLAQMRYGRMKPDVVAGTFFPGRNDII